MRLTFGGGPQALKCGVRNSGCGVHAKGARRGGCLAGSRRPPGNPQNVYENPVAQPPSAERLVRANRSIAGTAHPRAGVPQRLRGSHTRSHRPPRPPQGPKRVAHGVTTFCICAASDPGFVARGLVPRDGGAGDKPPRYSFWDMWFGRRCKMLSRRGLLSRRPVGAEQTAPGRRLPQGAATPDARV